MDGRDPLPHSGEIAKSVKQVLPMESLDDAEQTDEPEEDKDQFVAKMRSRARGRT
jgi:hypothetical protein